MYMLFVDFVVNKAMLAYVREGGNFLLSSNEFDGEIGLKSRRFLVEAPPVLYLSVRLRCVEHP